MSQVDLLHARCVSIIDWEFFTSFHKELTENDSVITKSVASILRIPLSDVHMTGVSPFHNGRRLKIKGWVSTKERDKGTISERFSANVKRGTLSREIQKNASLPNRISLSSFFMNFTNGHSQVSAPMVDGNALMVSYLESQNRIKKDKK